MDVITKPSRQKMIAYALRPMSCEDIAQVEQIDRQAFPEIWPPTSFRRELQNRLASYLVAYESIPQDPPESEPVPKPTEQVHKTLLVRLLKNVRYLWQRREEVTVSNREKVVGFVGIWYMADEAHITSIAVRNTHRRMGIGELLLIGSIEQAVTRGSREVTLEVRPSNRQAQQLYHKYGFREAGLRKGYYVDNNEDAIIMTTAPILVPPYPEQFRDLIIAHRERWGESQRTLS